MGKRESMYNDGEPILMWVVAVPLMIGFALIASIPYLVGYSVWWAVAKFRINTTALDPVERQDAVAAFPSVHTIMAAVTSAGAASAFILAPSSRVAITFGAFGAILGVMALRRLSWSRRWSLFAMIVASLVGVLCFLFGIFAIFS